METPVQSSSTLWRSLVSWLRNVAQSRPGYFKAAAAVFAIWIALMLILLASQSCTRVISWRAGESTQVNFTDSTTLLRPTKY